MKWLQDIFRKIVQNKSSNLKVKKTLEKLSFLVTFKFRIHPKFQLLRTRKLLVLHDIFLINCVCNESLETVVAYLVDKIVCTINLLAVTFSSNSFSMQLLYLSVRFYSQFGNLMFIHALKIWL